MTPITIAGKQYPWPEGCEYFDLEDNRGYVFYAPDWECDIPFAITVEGASKYELVLIAAVAARHFRNKQTKLVNEIEEVAFGIQAINGCDWSRHTELHELLTYCGKAAEQWEALCNDL